MSTRDLVAVEVGVEGRTYQRMQLNRLALDQHRLKGLDAETVQRRRPVEQDRMLADHMIQCVPHLAPLAFHHLFRLLDGGRQPQLDEA